ncbi:MAG: DUF2520 domain-containing protein [Pyrinomonadaceae bacterium MAG19_C2-C3]|nr:DUF2520 domain-containing protein [Pyrinomonadaceae bacterium MAG19_C2-C3]
MVKREPHDDTARTISHRHAKIPATNLRVAIIGAGRLGTAFAIALARVGYPLAAVVTRTAKNARRARTLIIENTPNAHQSFIPLALDAAHLDAVPPCDLYIFATPDDKLCDAAARLAAVYQPASAYANKRPVAIHLSGARTHHELDSLRAHKFQIGSCHPLISVSHPVKGSDDLAGAFFALEGDPAAVALARRIVKAIGGRVLQLDTRHKTLYHLAAVITSGHSVALFAVAIDLLQRCGIDRRTAQKVLLPLLHSTMQNLSVYTPERALTGSFARLDGRTIESHLAALAAHDETTLDARRIYALLGKRSLELALEQQAAKASMEAAREIKLMLEDAMSDERMND